MAAFANPECSPGQRPFRPVAAHVGGDEHLLSARSEGRVAHHVHVAPPGGVAEVVVARGRDHGRVRRGQPVIGLRRVPRDAFHHQQSRVHGSGVRPGPVRRRSAGGLKDAHLGAAVRAGHVHDGVSPPVPADAGRSRFVGTQFAFVGERHADHLGVEADAGVHVRRHRRENDDLGLQRIRFLRWRKRHPGLRVRRRLRVIVRGGPARRRAANNARRNRHGRCLQNVSPVHLPPPGA